MPINKIFGIGLNKTGTFSLHKALEILGFNSIHLEGPEGNIKEIILENHKKSRPLLEGLEHYDAFTDWNLPETNLLFKEFDDQYPGSKFIYTKRPLDDWIDSRERHVKSLPNLDKLRDEYPDSPWYHIDKKVWKKRYRELDDEVYTYFKGRPEDLLEIDITTGDQWQKICPFLGVEVPDESFPDLNKGPNMIQRIFRFLKSLG